MKKFIIAMMIICFAVTSAFAIDGLKVGAETGYTQYGITLKADDAKVAIGVGGFTFSGVATYQVVENVDAVVKLGFNAYGKPHTAFTYGGNTAKEVEDETVPVHFTTYVGGRYTYTINDQFSAYVGLGADMMVGKLDREDDKVAAFFGLNTELAGQYKINDKFTVNLGGTFTWFFADTAEEFKDIKKNVKDAGGSWFEYRFGATAGVTYSL